MSSKVGQEGRELSQREKLEKIWTSSKVGQEGRVLSRKEKWVAE